MARLLWAASGGNDTATLNIKYGGRIRLSPGSLGTYRDYPSVTPATFVMELTSRIRNKFPPEMEAGVWALELPVEVTGLWEFFKIWRRLGISFRILVEPLHVAILRNWAASAATLI